MGRHGNNRISVRTCLASVLGTKYNICSVNGGSLTVSLPDNLKSGDYLVRHEVCLLSFQLD